MQFLIIELYGKEIHIVVHTPQLLMSFISETCLYNVIQVPLSLVKYYNFNYSFVYMGTVMSNHKSVD